MKIQLHPIYTVTNATGIVRVTSDREKAMRIARKVAGRITREMVSLERYSDVLTADTERAARAYRRTKKRPLF